MQLVESTMAHAGSIVTILQDNIYVPDNFVEATLQFHQGALPLALQAMPGAPVYILTWLHVRRPSGVAAIVPGNALHST